MDWRTRRVRAIVIIKGESEAIYATDFPVCRDSHCLGEWAGYGPRPVHGLSWRSCDPRRRWGTSVSRDGVDFWTSGTPARRFEIIGTLTDTRSGQLAAGQAIGSPSLARTARALGGNGLILYNRQRRDGGYVGSWSGGDTIAPLRGPRATSTTMSFVVVRYLD